MVRPRSSWGMFFPRTFTALRKRNLAVSGNATAVLGVNLYKTL